MSTQLELDTGPRIDPQDTADCIGRTAAHVIHAANWRHGWDYIQCDVRRGRRTARLTLQAHSDGHYTLELATVRRPRVLAQEADVPPDHVAEVAERLYSTYL